MPIKSERLERWLRRNGNKWNERHGLRKAGAMFCWAAWRVLFLLSHPLARRRRMQVLVTVGRWELLRRRAPRDLAVTLPGDGTVICPPWTGSSRGILAVGLEDFAEQMFLLDTLRLDDVALDIGAHLGTYTVVMASRGAAVHAFEPSPRTREILSRTVANNTFSRPVNVHAVALSDFTGHAHFTDGLGSGNHLSEDGGDDPAATVAVDVDTLDHWATTHDLSGLFVIKIDAEGADENVLRGAATVLQRLTPVIIVEFWNDASPLRALLQSHGYETYRYQPRERRLVPLGDVSGTDGNLIACTPARLEDVRQRLDSSPHIELAPPAVHWAGVPAE